MSRHGSSRGYGNHQLENAIGGIIGLMIVLMVFLIFLFIKACNLIIRTRLKYPKNKPMRIQSWLVGIFGFCALLTGVAHLQLAFVVFETLALTTFLSLTLTAHVVQTHHNEHFLETDVKLKDRVLKRPWWTPVHNQIDAA